MATFIVIKYTLFYKVLIITEGKIKSGLFLSLWDLGSLALHAQALNTSGLTSAK
jgi:hypothetical protein